MDNDTSLHDAGAGPGRSHKRANIRPLTTEDIRTSLPLGTGRALTYDDLSKRQTFRRIDAEALEVLQSLADGGLWLRAMPGKRSQWLAAAENQCRSTDGRSVTRSRCRH